MSTKNWRKLLNDFEISEPKYCFLCVKPIFGKVSIPKGPKIFYIFSFKKFSLKQPFPRSLFNLVAKFSLVWCHHLNWFLLLLCLMGFLLFNISWLVKNFRTGLFLSSSLSRNEIWSVKKNPDPVPFLLTEPEKNVSSNLQILIWMDIWKSSIDFSKLLKRWASLSLSIWFKYLVIPS